FATGASNAEVEQNGTAMGRAGGSADMTGVGFGLAYYIDSANVYFLASVAMMIFDLEDTTNFNVYHSDDGIGFHGVIGKEWWVSQNWGLGIAGEFVGASLKDKDNTGVKWTGTSFSLLFSTTYN
ncbi:MAG TPA: hypothetical protein VIF57_29480, partial [Polyangia bacterium]